MRKYRSSAGSEVRVAYGIELAEGLRQFPETSEFAAPVQTQTQQLDTLQAERKTKVRELPAIRARVRTAEYNFDTIVRSAARALEVVDGGRRGAKYKAVFVDGQSAIVGPAGDSQVEVGKAFIGRVKDLKVDGITAWRDEWLPKMEPALSALETVCKARTDAYAAVAAVRAREKAAREDHERLVDKLMGEVRAAFPKDRQRWDVIFPRVTAPTRPDDDEPEEPEEPTE